MIEIIPFKQSDESRCGPACIKMILDYYGIKNKWHCSPTEDEICIRCGHTYELGCTDLQMKSAIESYGLGCIIINEASFDVIKGFIGRSMPVIVDWFSPGINPELGDMPNGHSSIVVDINDTYIVLLDPELGGHRVIKREEFLRVWFDWRDDPFLMRCEDLILRQVMVPIKLN